MELGSAAPRPITVLVADDSASLRALVRITLHSQGWEVVEAATAEAALAAARATPPPDLAVLDVNFGDTGPDGLAVCAELKADPATARIPIVILTAHDDPAERRRAEAAGADAFVGKPFGPLELTEGLRRLLPARPDAPALGVFLLDAGAVEPAVLENALAEQRESVERGEQKRLGDVLLAQGSVSTTALDRALLEQMHLRAMNLQGAKTRVLIVDDHHWHRGEHAGGRAKDGLYQEEHADVRHERDRHHDRGVTEVPHVGDTWQRDVGRLRRWSRVSGLHRGKDLVHRRVLRDEHMCACREGALARRSVETEHHDPRAGRLRAERWQRVDAGTDRHLVVEHDQVGLVPAREAEAFRRIRGLADELERVLPFDQGLESLAYREVIVDDEHARFRPLQIHGAQMHLLE